MQFGDQPSHPVANSLSHFHEIATRSPEDGEEGEEGEDGEIEHLVDRRQWRLRGAPSLNACPDIRLVRVEAERL